MRNALPSIETALATASRTRAKSTVEIGRLLVEAKDLVQPGESLAWLQANFPLSNRTPERHMAVLQPVDARGLKIDTVSNLDAALLSEMVHFPRFCEQWKEDEIQAVLAEAASRPVCQNRAYEISKAVRDARPDPTPE